MAAVTDRMPGWLSSTYQTLGQKTQDYIRDEAQRGEQGFLTSVAIFRLITALVVFSAAMLYPEDYINNHPQLSWPVLTLYIFIAIGILLVRIKRPNAFLSENSHYIQVILDILFANAILLIHEYLQSTLFIVLIFPVMIAGRYFPIARFLLVWLFDVLSLLIVMMLVSNNASPQWINSAILSTWLPKALILSAIAYFAFLYQQVKTLMFDEQQKISLELLSISDVDHLATLFCQRSVEMIPNAESSVLHLYNRENNMLECKETYCIGDDSGEPFPFRLGEGVSSVALLKRRVIYLPRVRDKRGDLVDSRFIEKPEGRQFQSLLVAPLYVGEKHIGTISLDHSKPRAFNKQSIKQLTILASQASIALANAMEFQQHEKRYSQLQKILLYGQTKLIPEKGLENLLAGVIDGAKEILGFERAEVYAFGFIPRRLPGVVLDKDFVMYDLIHDAKVQRQLRDFTASRYHFTYTKKEPSSPDTVYNYCVPLIGAENRPIGLLSLGSNEPVGKGRDVSQEIWLYANDVAREIEVGILIELRTNLQKILSQLEKTADTEQDAQTLQNGFRKLGFRRGVVKITAGTSDQGPKFSRFGFNGNTDEATIVENNLLFGKQWIRKNIKNVRQTRLLEGILYFSWNDGWVNEEFQCPALNIEDEQGFLYIRGAGSKASCTFEAVLGITDDMVTPTENWAKEVQFLTGSMAKSVENVYLTAEQAANDARQEERTWWRGDIHDALNTIQAGPLLFSEAARNEFIAGINGSYFSKQSEDAILSHLKTVESSSRFVYNNLSQLMEKLGRPTLRESGLPNALREFCDMLGWNTHLSVDIDPEDEQRLSKQERYILYRIAQEGITNAMKHAGIDTNEGGLVTVSLRVTPAGNTNKPWQFIIADNGCGFKQSVEAIRKNIDSFGLRQTEKWARRINARMSIESSSVGTKIWINSQRSTPSRVV